MIKEGEHSRTDAAPSVCIWYPKEHNIRINPHAPSDEDTFWYLELASGISIAAGRYRGDLADDAAAMRALAAAAAALAGLLEEKAAAGA